MGPRSSSFSSLGDAGSGSESDLTDLDEIQPPPTPGQATEPEDDSGVHLNSAMDAPGSSRRRSGRPRRKSQQAGDVGHDDAQNEEGQPAAAPSQAEASTSRRRIKVKEVTRQGSTAAEEQGDAATTETAAKPKKSIKVKLNVDRSKAQQQQQQVQQADGFSLDAAPQSGSSSLRDELRGMADSDEEDEEEVIAPVKRKMRRPRESTSGAGGDHDDDEGGDISMKRKKRKPEDTSRGSALKKARRSDYDDADALLESDSDEEMQDVASSEGDYEEDEKKTSGRSGSGKSSAKKTSNSSTKGVKSSDSTKGKASASGGKAKSAAPAGNKKQLSKAGGSDNDPKSAVGKIRASAAVTAASGPSSSSPSHSADGAGGSSLSSPIPRKPQGQTAPGAAAGQPPRRPMPLPPMKPRGSDMWDSLVGSSKPRPQPVPPAAAKKEGDDAAKQQQQQKPAGPRPPRPPPPSASALPRPLGTTGTPSTGGPPPRPRSHLYGPGSASAHNSGPANGTFTVHMTPGLNGQHWDKAAYRQLRASECHSYSNPEPASLFNLLEDAEVLAKFEEEWRGIRYPNLYGGRAARDEHAVSSRHAPPDTTAPLPHLELFQPCKYTQYGSGRLYADVLKGRKGAHAMAAAARVPDKSEQRVDRREGQS
ncbi:hypothetical protein BDZ90DRAFT_261083 [Jaminaea rosea]|uniref:Uncharacterized protein n=1 Tax=Jaminaea rosea TaxID=1569628 RepID=A0A316UR88_9BASI|nr:hypothetical protein BDZ90DRAFT_261083 [Jaminaea rosea]PWN26831.1 hypothetical protein BDZ90DRAFT_261083 [Jaminaea rosea]